MVAQYVKIPFLGKVCAGSPGMAICGTPSTITVAKGILKPEKKYYALMVSGDSMRDTHKDGKTILVENGQDIEKGDVIIARVQDGDTIKRVKKNDRKNNRFGI